MEILDKNIEDISSQYQFDYSDDCIFFSRGLHEIPECFFNSRLQLQILCFCFEGNFSVVSNGNQFNINKYGFFIYLRGDVISEFKSSDDCKIALVGYTWKIIEQMQPLATFIWPISLITMQQKDFKLEPDRFAFVTTAINQLWNMAVDPDPLFRTQIVHNIVMSLVYNFVRHINKQMNLSFSDCTSHDSLLETRFFEILSNSGYCIQSVAEVADKLHVTSKHLCKVIKKSTGRSPLRYVQVYKMRAVNYELKFTTLSLKEISEKLGFSSIAFFAKFVKQQSGMTPTAYRDYLRTVR
ncbi:MAG: helix-turn-helix transcriptional regulator [Bacteroidales bacterium]|nr:helix-turn-helix transcriptional regulator [Bacteroidales bacterium]